MIMRFIKEQNGILRPADRFAHDKMKFITNGSEVEVEITAERNDKQFHLYWCAIKLCYDHLHDRLPDVKTEKQFSDLLQAYIAKKGNTVAGRFAKYGDIIIFERASLSYKNMNQERFDKYFDLAIDEMCLWMSKAGLELTREELIENAKEYYNE